MRVPRLRTILFLPPLLFSAILGAQQLPEVKERILRNGFRVFLVERPGSGAFHAALFVRGGMADTGSLPPSAAGLLAKSLFGKPLPEDMEEGAFLDGLLKLEEGAYEALRLERIRQERMASGNKSPELVDLEALHQRALEPLNAKIEAADRWDVLDALGAARRRIQVTADYLSSSIEMPRARLPEWCHLESQRLRRLHLGRFPLERQRRIQELSRVGSSSSLSVLLSAALPGLPYAQVADEERNTLESIRWSELRAYAQWAITPGRMHLVLVGDLRANETWPLLETSFGKLDGVSEITGRSENPPADVLERSGARRLQASQDVRPVLYMSWRIPPKLHPDAKTLDLLACLLGVGEASRLQQRIVAGPAIASRIDVRTGVPGAREVNLLLIEAEPASGRNLAELELALSSEILRLQREPIQDTEIRRAQSLMETAELRTLSDADSLARAMGEALCRGGDWRLAFPLLLPGKPVTQESLQAVARKYLIPNHATIALVEPDPLLAPQDALEKDLARLLTALVQKKLEDPARREALVREALRQLRMVSRDERLQVARLLDAQVKP